MRKSGWPRRCSDRRRSILNAQEAAEVAMKERLTDTIGQNVTEKLGKDLHGALQTELHDKLEKSLHDTLHDNLSKSLATKLHGDLTGDLTGALEKKLQAELDKNAIEDNQRQDELLKKLKAMESKFEPLKPPEKTHAEKM